MYIPVKRIKAGTSEYSSIHYWIRKVGGRPQHCEHCKSTGPDKKYEWANKSGQYLREREDWLRLCKSCHHVYDKRKAHCPKGHPYDTENSYFSPKGNQIGCRQCNRDGVAAHAAKHPAENTFNTWKTHCNKGHEFTPENTRTELNTNFRRCLTCKKNANKKAHERYKLKLKGQE